MASNANVITKAIKFEADQFIEKSIAQLKANISECVRNTYEEVYSGFETKLKSEIMQTIGTKDMFDYSDLPAQSIIFSGNPEAIDLSTFIGEFVHGCVDKHGESVDAQALEEQFMKLQPGEKVVITNEFCDLSKIVECYLITNYARCIGVSYINGVVKVLLGHFELNYWIPKDYIQVLRLILSAKPNSEPAAITVKFADIIETLRYIKDHLYDRKIVPLYAADVMSENAALIAKYDEFEREKNKFERFRDHFMQNVKPYIELEAETRRLVKERECLTHEAERLRMIAKRLALDRKKFEEERAELDNIDITNI